MKRMLVLGVLCLFVLAGCGGGYWMETDPTSKNVYYTEEVEGTKGGAVKFKDAKTRSQVTLQNSEVMGITKDQFKAAVGR